MTDSDSILIAANIHKSYGERRILTDISFALKRGEVVGFLGPNGAGKTTTMRILTGYIPADEGAVHIDGQDLATASERAKSRLGYLPETPPLYGEMTGREYLTFAARIKGMPEGEIPAAVDRALAAAL